MLPRVHSIFSLYSVFISRIVDYLVAKTSICHDLTTFGPNRDPPLRQQSRAGYHDSGSNVSVS